MKISVAKSKPYAKIASLWHSIVENYSLFTFLCVFFMFFLRKSTVFSTPYIWIEDSEIFLQRAMYYGVESLFVPYASYYHFVPQTIALLFYWLSGALGLGITYIPYMINILMLFIQTSVLCFFLKDDFSWLVQSRKIRVAIILLFAFLLPACDKYSSEVWHSLANFQWWMGIFIYFFGLRAIHYKKVPQSIALNSILFATGLSTPLSVFTVAIYVFVLGYSLIALKNVKIFLKENVKSIVFTVIQAVPVLITVSSLGGRVATSVSDTSLWERLRFILVFSLGRITSIFDCRSYFQIERLNVLVGFLIWLTLFILAQKKAFIFISFTFYMGYFTINGISTGGETINSILSYQVNTRLYFMSYTILIFTFLVVISQRYILTANLWPKYASALICFLVFLAAIPYLQLPIMNPAAGKLYQTASKYYDKKSTQHVWIQGPYTRFRMKIPITLDATLADTEYFVTIDTVTHEEAYGYYTITGWLVNFEERKVPESVFVRVGNGQYSVAHTLKRKDVAEAFNSNNYTMSGFSVVVYANKHDNEINRRTLEFMCVNANGTEYHITEVMIDPVLKPYVFENWRDPMPLF